MSEHHPPPPFYNCALTVIKLLFNLFRRIIQFETAAVGLLPLGNTLSSHGKDNHPGKGIKISKCIALKTTYQACSGQVV